VVRVGLAPNSRKSASIRPNERQRRFAKNRRARLFRGQLRRATAEAFLRL
jgi:hypothetical protein